MKSQTRRVLTRCLSFGLIIMLLWPMGVFAAGPDVTGLWQGSLDIPGGSLGIEIELIEAEAAQLSGSLSIPAQGAEGLSFTAVKLDGNHLVLTIDLPGGASFDGILTEDGSIQGTFTQAGQAFPFSVRREVHLPPVIESDLDSLQGLDEFIAKGMEDWQVPGIAVAIVQNGEVIYAKGFGLRNVSGKLPVTTETLFGIGSTTKAFTTALLGMLADEKQLDWDKAVKEYIPGFELQDPLASSRTTLRDLATHRIGLPRNDFAVIYNSELTRESIAANMDELAPNADFRTTWQYNNFGYVMAGYAAELVSEQSWEELIEQRIFAPLGMDDSNLSVAEMMATDDYALPYAQLQNALTEVDFWQLGAAAPCGSINSSVMDMAEWLKFQLNGGKVGDQQLLSSYQLAMMHSPQISMAATSSDSPIQFSSYGLGWMIESYRGHYLVHHGGNVAGHTAEVALLPGEDSGIVILGNLQGTPLPSLIMYDVADRLLGLESLDLSGQAKQALAAAAASSKPVQTSTPATALTAAQLREYVGQYQHPFYGPVRVSVVKGKLQASYYQTEISLSHQNHDVFAGQLQLWPVDIPFHFQRSLTGDIDQVLIGFEPAGALIAFTRQEVEQALDLVLAQKMVGQYEVQGTPVSVKLVDGKLTMSLPNQPRYDLQPIGGTKFNLRELPGYYVEFVVNQQSGQVTGITFTQPNGVFPGQRVN